jgi:hypothetical protein
MRSHFTAVARLNSPTSDKCGASRSNSVATTDQGRSAERLAPRGTEGVREW